MLISAQIRYRTKEVRKYGLVEVGPSMSMSVFDMLRKCLLHTGDNFVLEEQYCCHDVGVPVVADMLEPGQTAPLMSKVEDVIVFGKYFTFKLTGDNQAAENALTVNAFELIRDAQ